VLFGPRPLIIDSHVDAVLPPGKARAISNPAEESKYVQSYMVDFLIKDYQAKYDKMLHKCIGTVDLLKMRFKTHFRDITFSNLIPGVLNFLSLCLSPTT
jgi:hypothetical protein